jgi:hypothetical protein
MYKKQSENLESMEFHKIGDHSGIGVKKSKTGFIVLTKSNFQGDYSDRKILVPYMLPDMKKHNYNDFTDLSEMHNETTYIGQYIAHVAQEYANDHYATGCRILRKGYRVGY